MKRHPLLVPLSHEHHHTLALCTRILRSPEADHRADITEHYIDTARDYQKPYWKKGDPPLNPK